MKILVFGNPLVKQDSIALALVVPLRKKFPEIEFKEFDPAENLEGEGRDLIILDAVLGIDQVRLIEDLNKIELGKIYSMHDFDLAITLKILMEIKAIDSVKIIAVPTECDLKKALNETANLISSLLSKSA
jgi:Ni,Fe-hydrogenase maturation factor